MQYIRSGNDYIIRFDRGDELITELTGLCKEENIRAGSISGLGASDEVTLGVFNLNTFQYEKTTFRGVFEIASCVGNASRKDGEVYLHLHMTVANPSTGQIYAGHLNACHISLTGEFFLHAVDAEVEREYSDQVGLNLMKF